jgi:Protein of unknown function (DUF2924)
MLPKALNIAKEIAALERMTAKQLRERYAVEFGETTNANNRIWLLKRIAWRLQAMAEGGLSERAKARAAELARDADLRVTPPTMAARLPGAATRVREMRFEADGRLPAPGTVITREYKGGVVQVKVLTEGFEYAGEVYRSLSAVAKAVTGSHCNGYLFFRMTGKERAA